ncbi:NDR1/HIN1-like protein 1 [Nicotiana tabacum]|uniref:NDR1/HIN1-like protein 1 n=2 Tax=Nicotiana TaxID=4085 RepID=A0A1S4B532_TOBAC|nr:PREDICTED: protein YLS9-like [Nicotiana sylvestris]XP_016483956.1 PREDICTED: protein YLS9-like [Nicotiana tabacum]
MSPKDCGHHDEERHKLHRRLFVAVLAFVILVLFIIFLIWLILRPTKPSFILHAATIYAFNVSSPNIFLTTNIQITLASRNPNNKIGIYYDKLDVYATYRGQQITLPTLLPSTYQGHKDVTIWSPFVYGNSVPVAPFLSESLNQDQMAGTVLINIKVDGRIRWKVGTFISGKYHLYVNCPAYVGVGGKMIGNSIAVGSAMKYQLVQNCHVDV